MIPRDKEGKEYHLYFDPNTGDYVFSPEGESNSSFVFPTWCYSAIREQINIGHFKVWPPKNHD